ncbi:39S ribosomal protein L19, mitochondrial isoform X2 [Ooceraea biroi]|uniref:39S ribosomal protein L19, mitochondrial isoform X2 n=1 Tax=Ooceraea biroi TaxID=2015173 RepID=UPI0005B9B5A9|nr:39S ribosomal protein L19, mitochondrial isoform X2 [Ooceraea biroi]
MRAGVKLRYVRSAVRTSTSTTVSGPTEESPSAKVPQKSAGEKKAIPDRYRFMYPELLPDPNPKFRNAMREKLERMDMLARRTHVLIPEFYIGSILSVTYSEPHAPGKVNKFVGICIQRGDCGLRAWFILRNVVDGQGVEVKYEMYDPTIQKIECLKLEKRLDPHLRYLRDAPLEYSTFSFDMEPEYLAEGTAVPVNKTRVKLNLMPWIEKWERQELRGIIIDPRVRFTENRLRKGKVAATPWVKYDLMKTYRETIPEEDQNEIFSEVYTQLRDLEIANRRQKHKRPFIRPKKTG